jgi:hypothetical protein
MVTCIQTFTGKMFYPLRPVVRDICIEDIAHALSHQCRFSGHTRHHYSVAQHSVHVYQAVKSSRRWPAPADKLLRWALLHDASEAYLVDLPSPLKASSTLGPAYETAEKRLMRAVCRKFQMPQKMPDEIKLADLQVLAAEARDLMTPNAYWGKLGVTPWHATVHPWQPEVAKATFLKVYREIAAG